VAPIALQGRAKGILIENGQTLIAEANYGKGYVLVIGDPWLYNEYIGHLYLPTDFENGKAAQNLVNLLMSK
jgi:unsaturated rhamnogalacturonyl hydrolase